MNRRRKFLIATLALLLLVGGGKFGLEEWKSRATERVVIREADCVEVRDADCLFDLSKGANPDISRAQWKRIFNELIVPRLPAQATRSEVGRYFKSYNTIRLVDDSGKFSRYLSLDARNYYAGPRISLTNLLYSTWQFTFDDGPYNKRDPFKAHRAGLAAYGPLLDAIGVHGDRGVHEEFYTWGQLLEIADKRIASRDAAEAKWVARRH